MIITNTLQNQYIETINKSLEHVKGNLPEDLVSKLIFKMEVLNKELKEGVDIKIPLIGDFSAGKSTLINAFIGREGLLPTNIRPETAVSYELYFAPEEYVEIYRGEKLLSTKKVNELNNQETQPGDVIKVFINNNKVKSLVDRNIILVDMPGLDSGLEEHNKAIQNYIKDGVVFIVLVDIEQGSLRSSTLSFVREISQYNLSSRVVIAKSDKKPESEANKVREYVTEQAQKYIKGDSFEVGLVSANDGDIADFDKILESLDSMSIYESKFKPPVIDFIDECLSNVRMHFNVLDQDIEEIEGKLLSIKNESEKARKKIISKKEDLSSITSRSADDILYEITKALEAREMQMASLLMKGKEGQVQIGNEIISIVRPVMISSLQSESDKLTSAIKEEMVDILSNLDSFITTGPDFNNMVSENAIKGYGNKVKPITDKFFKNSRTYKSVIGVLGLATSVIAPWVEVIIFFAPEIFSFFMGDSKEKKQKRYAELYLGTVIPNIKEKLKPEIKKSLLEQQETILNTLDKQIVEEIEKLEESIKYRIIEEENNKESISIQKNELLESEKSLIVMIIDLGN